MGIKRSQLTIIFFMMLVVTGCSSKIPVPYLEENRYAEAKDGWKKILANHVDNEGRVDFSAVSDNKAQLENWLGYVARHGPNQADNHRFDTRAQRMSFYIDAYNALAMYGVLNAGVYPQDKVRFFLLRQYLVGGEWMSLYYLENSLIRLEKDPRVHFALNCMSLSCPRLQQVTWDENTISQQLDDATRQFISEARNLRIDHEQKQIWLSELFDFYPEDFGPLVPFINRYRDRPLPENYEIKFTPYDWSFISQ